MLLDKISRVITEVDGMSPHIEAHIQQLARDKSKANEIQAARNGLAQAMRMNNALRNQFQKAQEARLRRLQQKEEGNSAEQAKIEAEKQKLEMHREKAEIDTAMKIEQHQADLEAKKTKAQADGEARVIKAQAESEIKREQAKEAAEAKKKDGSN
jgi:membrane protein involved in colicin uptake